VLILPAIDLKDGQCVRLRQGRADEATVYASDPVEMALRWQAQGAPWLHLVDLDGAFQGRPVHTEVIARIAAALSIPVELGGGLRTDADVAAVLDCGVRRAIVGTRAIGDRAGVARLAREFGEALAVGIDARDGRVQVRGWVETTDVDAYELGRDLAGLGVRTLIYTDTATDGMLTGVNAAAMGRMCESVSCRVIASGGVASVADIAALRSLERPNLDGAIVGKALYESRVTLAELLAAV
jgi:phosphoribosylformimino-5-aminoimidazole carboxamide ribotide isomerase